MSQPYVSNVISNKYDSALDFHVTMYDNLPYQRDSDYCNAEKLALVSGRVIKFYLCMNEEQVIAIDNKDDSFDQILEKNRIQAAIAKQPKPAHAVKEEDGITQEQIQTLLDNKEESPAEGAEGDELDASADAVNAFADVEDW